MYYIMSYFVLQYATSQLEGDIALPSSCGMHL